MPIKLWLDSTLQHDCKPTFFCLFLGVRYAEYDIMTTGDVISLPLDNYTSVRQFIVTVKRKSSAEPGIS